MSHNPNYTKYSNFSKSQEAPVVEPDAVNTLTEEPVVTSEPEVEETPEAPVVEEENNELIGVVANCEKLNVRRGPDADAEVLTVISKGTEVQIDIFESTNGFYKVCTGAGIEGFCKEDFISVD